MALCSHGITADECLICATLGSNAPGGRGERGWGNGPAVTERTAASGTDGGRFQSHRAAAASSGVQVVDRGGPADRLHRPGATVALVVVAVIAALAAVWVVAGVVFALLRIVEVVAVAIAAGWIGYRIGHWRARHGH